MYKLQYSSWRYYCCLTSYKVTMLVQLMTTQTGAWHES